MADNLKFYIASQEQTASGPQADTELRSQVERLTQERDQQAAKATELEGQLGGLTRERDDARAALAKAEEEGGAAQAQLSTVTRERDEAQARLRELEASAEKVAKDYAEALGGLNGLAQELDALKAQPLLPPDARERLIKVKGINETLADAALAALTPQAE